MINTVVLIIFFLAPNSTTSQQIPGWSSLAACEIQADKLNGAFTPYRAICINIQ